jgi:hypothetical protein
MATYGTPALWWGAAVVVLLDCANRLSESARCYACKAPAVFIKETYNDDG